MGLFGHQANKINKHLKSEVSHFSEYKISCVIILNTDEVPKLNCWSYCSFFFFILLYKYKPIYFFFFNCTSIINCKI